MEARKKKSSRLLAWVVVIAVAFTMTFPTAFVWGAETGATQETVAADDQTPGEDPAAEESSNKDPTEAVKAEPETKKPAVKAAAKAAAAEKKEAADENVDTKKPHVNQEAIGGTHNAGTVFFAEGYDVTIDTAKDLENEKMGFTATWIDGDKQESLTVKREITKTVEKDKLFVVGGTEKDNTNLEATNITVKGGSMDYVIGGNLNVGAVKTANIEILDGNIGMVIGTTKDGPNGSYDKRKEKASVETVNIKVAGGDMQAVVGGTYAYTYVKNVNVEVTGGTIAATTSPMQAGILLGGTNGEVENAKLTFSGGKTKDIALGQRVMITGKATLDLTGGNAGNIYAGSYYDDGDNAAGTTDWNGWGAGHVNYGQAKAIDLNLGENLTYNDVYAGFQFIDKAKFAEKYTAISDIKDSDKAPVNITIKKAGEAKRGDAEKHTVSMLEKVLPSETLTIETSLADGKVLDLQEGCTVIVKSGVKDIKAKIGKKDVTLEASDTYTVKDGKLVGSVAKIGDTNYASIEEAIAAAEKNGTIKMLQDIDIETPITISKSINLDLNGHVITGAEASNINKTIVLNGADATLTIEDTSSEKKGEITSHDNGTTPRVLSVEKGNLILNNGTITTKGLTVAGSAVFLGKDTTFVMNGGKIDTPSSSVKQIGVNVGSSGASFNLKNGDITSEYGDCISLSAGAALKMEGGTVTNSGELGTASALSGAMSRDTKVNISGGRLEGKNYAIYSGQHNEIKLSGGTYIGKLKLDNTQFASITGGTFSTNPSAYVVKDYAVNKTDKGYNVVKATDAAGEALIGNTYYKTLADAIVAAKEKDTVKLNKDVQVTMTAQNTAAILIDKNITLDGNGKTITATGDTKAIGHVIEVSNGVKAAVKNLTIDGNQIAKHGIQVYSKEEPQSEAKVTSVTVKNCTGYGFMINGGKMIATRITAEANGWGGVNIGQGTDVTAEPSFTFNSGTLQEHNPIQADNVGDKAPSTSWVIFGDNAGTWYATKSVRKEDNKTLIQWSSQLAGEAQTDGVTYPTLKEAIEAAKAGTIVTLLKDVTVDMGTEKNNPAILIDKAIDFNGNGKTITAKGDKEGIGHVLGVQSSNVEINALTIDGNNGTARHGIQTYGEGSAATLTEVTVKDCYGYGIVANGSAVTANGLYTSGNGWGGVNVTKGSGVTADPKFEFNYGDLQQDNPIQIDNVDKTVEVKAEWVAIHEDMASDWHSVTTTDDGKTIIQFAPGAAIKSLSLNTSAMTLTEGNKGQLIATIEPEEAYDTSIEWTASNTDKITVDDNGVVTALKTGEATVTATAADGTTKAECKITVIEKAADKEPVKVIVEPSKTTATDDEGTEQEVINEADVKQAIDNAKEKEEVVVKVPADVPPVLSEDVFAAASESKAAKLIVEVPATKDTYAATFEFDTAAIENMVAVDTKIEKKDITDVSGLSGDAAKLGLTLSHEGDFPAPATITIAINDNSIKDGDTVYIYYLNNGKLQLIDNGPLTVKDRKVTFTLSHASDYVISSEPIEPETAADSVDALIGKIGTVAYTDDVYQAIKAAKEAYNGFEKQYEGQTSLVKQHATMKAADEQYTKWDDQVKAFKSDIDDLYEAVDGAMTYAQQKKVEALTAAYKALNADQIEALDWDGYGKDGYYGDLLAIRDASKDAEIVSQANRVSKLVDQLPAAATYSTADKSKIDAARNMYNSVVAETPDAKALLTADLAKIEKAEAEYKNAKRTAYNNARISLSTTQYMYNGKAKTPAVYGLSAFANGTDYTVAYSNNTKTGKATVTVTGRGDCAGLSTKIATFRITPAKAAISKLKKGKKSFKVTIKSQKSAGVSGYQISYSLKKNKSFKSTTTTKTSKTVKKLKAKRTYYVKVRSYKTIDGKKYYGSYSKIKKIKTR